MIEIIPKSNASDLDTKIHNLGLVFNGSVTLVMHFVDDFGDSIKRLERETADLYEWLTKYQKGELYVEPENGSPAVEAKFDVSEEQVRRVVSRLRVKREFVVPNFPSLTHQLALVYMVATFDAYMADILELVIVSRPEILKSAKQVRYDEILGHGSMESLIRHLARREIQELGYKSLNEQFAYYEKRFGISLENPAIEKSELIKLRATRNIIIHNNGKINEMYREQVPDSPYVLGERIKVDRKYVYDSLERIVGTVGYVTSTLLEKFGKTEKSEEFSERT